MWLGLIFTKGPSFSFPFFDLEVIFVSYVLKTLFFFGILGSVKLESSEIYEDKH